MADAVGGTLFSPAGSDVSGIKGDGIETGQRSAAVVDGIGFKKTGFGFIPLVGFNGNVVFK